jgi:hypothetical protein
LEHAFLLKIAEDTPRLNKSRVQLFFQQGFKFALRIRFIAEKRGEWRVHKIVKNCERRSQLHLEKF